MAWSELKNRFDKLPLILAGPILRQVTPHAVTVWVALKQSAQVTLTVYDSDVDFARRTLMVADRPTTALGKNLHVVAVTARKDNALTENRIYFYDLTFNSISPPSAWTFSQAVSRPTSRSLSERFAYSPYLLPSFVLPPSDPNKLRLIHGSCRKPHGGGPVAPDALAMLNSLIADKVDKPLERPHQLILTGDQIYADEVAEALLLMLTDAGDTLLDWMEEMPAAGNEGPNFTEMLPPTTRSQIIQKAGFTTDDTRSHLMSLSEYFAMYLFVWSEELWPDIPTDIPDIDAVQASLPPGMIIAKDVKPEIDLNRQAITNFFNSLPDVRRALANIPTYMICDDHEITDDWNMTLEFCNKVYGNPLGRRIVQNGLIAYSICQAWGNLPEQFERDPQEPAGLQLLNALESVAQAADQPAKYNSLDSLLMKIVGVHKREDMDAVGDSVRVFHEIFELDRFKVRGVNVSSSSLRFNFSVEGPAHQILVTDTRTWRWFTAIHSHPDYPGSQLFVARGPKPDFLPDDILDDQLIRDVPQLGNRELLLVVFTTNAPPIATIRMFGRIALESMINKYDLFDSWEFPSASFDRMIVAISDKLPKVGGVLTGSVIFLSGDVHFSFSSRLAYWAEIQRLGDPPGQPQKATMVVAQLVASALKNEADKTRGEQLEGYTYMPPDVEAGLKKIAN
jgi:hypothetical protein